MKGLGYKYIDKWKTKNFITEIADESTGFFYAHTYLTLIIRSAAIYPAEE